MLRLSRPARRLPNNSVSPTTTCGSSTIVWSRRGSLQARKASGTYVSLELSETYFAAPPVPSPRRLLSASLTPALRSREHRQPMIVLSRRTKKTIPVRLLRVLTDPNQLDARSAKR
jgi:hypothetical protein